MASVVQDKIRKILRDEGKGILLNFIRFDQLIREYLPDFKREAFVVARLLEAGIPQAFQLAAHRLDMEFLRGQFQNVVNLYRFSEEAIALGFSAWARALDLPYPSECNAKALMEAFPDRAFPPMGNRVSHGLAELMLRYGQTTCFAKNWLEARLKKTFPLYRGEVFLLTCLLERKIPQELATLGKGRQIDPLLPKLENRILAEIPFEPGALRWAIESWGFALGLDIPPHSQIFTNTIMRGPRSDVSKPKPVMVAAAYPSSSEQSKASTSTSTAKEDSTSSQPPLLRPAFVYILIFSTCLLIYNQSVMMRKIQRLEKSAVPLQQRPFVAPEESEESTPNETTVDFSQIPHVDGPEAFRRGLAYFTGITEKENKPLARAYFKMAAEQDTPGAKAYLAFMMITGDGGVDDQEGADSILQELLQRKDHAELALLYDLLKRSALAQNPIAEKMVSDIKSGNGPFQLTDLPPSSFTHFYFINQLASHSNILSSDKGL